MAATNIDRPNIVVFLTDQQRWDTTGVHGNPLDLTPNFDRVARAGTHIAASFTCQPVCGPARAAFQTGRFPTDVGCFRNSIPLPQDARTLAHDFRDAGYRTAYIGKWHLAAHEPVPPEERGGYEYWLASNILEFTSEAYDTIVYDGDEQPVKLPGYRVDALTDAAIRYVAEQADGEAPFFLFLSFLEPHHQNRLDDFVAPDGYRERYQNRWIPPDLAALGGSTQQHIAGYYGQVKRVDEAFGRLLDALKSLRLSERTIVLFTSDHGCHFKTRNSEYKRSCHEASIRVPTALIGPGFTGGGQVQALVSHIHLPPTLLDAAGIPVPPVMQGRSIVPLVHGNKADWTDEAFVQVSESQVGRALRTQRWKYSIVAPEQDGNKVPGAEEYTEEFLYDLTVDPYELRNLIHFGSHRAVAAMLRERLMQQMVAAGETAPRIVPAVADEDWRLHVLPDEAVM